MKRLMVLIVTLGCLGFLFGCLNDIEEVPLDPGAADIEPPRGLAARVDDGIVILSWIDDPSAARYRLYRGREEAARPELIAESADTFHVDHDVRNGQEYFYSVSAVTAEGIEGGRCEPIAAIPTAYSIIINAGDPYTGSRSVALQLSAPATTALMMIANSAGFEGSVWETHAAARGWRLPEGDGAKAVYVRFRDANGSESPVMSDMIYLDTYAAITEIDVSPAPYRYSPGSTVGFEMRVAGSETEGEAWIELENFGERIYLKDDGRGGDATSSDGVYATDFTFPTSMRGIECGVTGSFIDRAGNAALPFESDVAISFTDPPEPVVLIGVQESTVSSVTIRWIPSDEEHFARYEIYRNTEPGVADDPALLVRRLSNVDQSADTSDGLLEGETYYFRIYVVNDLEESAGSNEISAQTFDAYPTPVTLDTLSAVGTTRVTLNWSANADTDFREYRIYRSTNPGVTEASLLVTSIDTREITYFDDTGLNLSGFTYYYRVYVYDRGGKSARSNEVTTAD